VTYGEVIDAIHATLPGKRSRPSKKTVHAIIKRLAYLLQSKVLFDGGSVRVAGLGTFVRTERKGRFIAPPPGVKGLSMWVPTAQGVVLRSAKACRRQKPPALLPGEEYTKVDGGRS